MRESGAEDLRDVEAVLNGDEEAYARLVERHGPAVKKQMWNFSRDPLTAEELAQDVFVEAYLSLGTFRAEAPFRHWLSRIATLVGYKFWKKRDKARKQVSLSEAPDLPAREGDARDPAAAAELLHDLLAELPPADRMAMTLMYLEKCNQEEIAERMGWTRVMVAVRLHRAKGRLRKLGEREPWKGRLEWMLS
jgi:RNA polymerase sigma-70 factor (ECF subfamily)